ncbi:hypothetical protein SI65_06130 [Aspergillus cristatus]|uniref:AMP-dependent synthetase/ligase domain-containing protein n=1 Tax=Aspergillus cristatus TaxID=573508 RepID=A0A1E3BBE5_ASPCR|nr:hypothetical protein SI65_06130 [Aspergillus cristatus]
MRAGDALTRYGIVPDDNDGWIFIWTVHHAVYDGWTLDLLFDRLDKAYKGQAPVQDYTFKEFMAYVLNTDADAGRQFWAEYLAGAIRNEFPSTVSMSKQPVADASLIHDMAVNTSNADELSGITLPSMTRASWGILIGTHSESDDVVFGNIVSGRSAPVSNADQLFGPGIAAVPVRVKFPDSSRFTIRLQNISRVSVDASAACDFQTLLVMQPAKEEWESTDDVDLRAVSEADAAFGTYAITLELEGEQIRRILYQLENLLQQIITSPVDKKVSELDFLSTYDKMSISEWNKSIPSPVNQTIHDLIEKQIAERPDHEAICALKRISPAALRRVVGRRLPCLGLKSSIIVCSPEQYELCRGMGDEYTVVVLGNNSPEQIPESAITILAEVKPENAAYVIFTSGNTGEPKGTVITHGAFACGSLTHSTAMLMDGSTRALQFASWTFDASIVETLTVFINADASAFPPRNSVSATLLTLTPSFINLVKPDDVPSINVLILAGEAMSQSHVETWGHRVRLINGYGPSECCVASVTNIDVKLGASPRNIGYACSGVAWVTMPHDHRLLAPVGSVGELVLEVWNAGRGCLNEPEKTAAAFVENPLWLDLPGQQRPPVVYKTGDLVAYNADGSLGFQRRKDTQVKLRGQRAELGEIEYRIKQNLPDHPDTIVDILWPKDAPDQPRLVAFLPHPAAYEDPDANIILPTAPEHHLTAVSGLEDRLADFLPMHMIPSAYMPVAQIPKLPSGKADRKTLKRCGSELTHRQMAENSGATEDVRPPTTET